ncbi:KilA-N domain-containing protein [Candidatus Hepatincola sp. Pdp]
MAKIQTITVNNIDITINTIQEEDYICLSDILKHEEYSSALVENWLRNKNTVEFLGVWEQLNNKDKFNSLEFEGIKNQTGLNRFHLSVKKWVNSTNAIGLISKAGKYGGIYAHVDIALEFCSWLSPILKLHIITEYKRLKKEENNRQGIEWQVKRELAKTNYHMQNYSVAKYIVPRKQVAIDKQRQHYQDEANLLNVVLFGITAEKWRIDNPELANQDKNIRDYASENELTVLANLETHNAQFIKEGIHQGKRKDLLTDIKNEYLNILNSKKPSKSISKQPAFSTIKELSSLQEDKEEEQ